MPLQPCTAASGLLVFLVLLRCGCKGPRLTVVKVRPDGLQGNAGTLVLGHHICQVVHAQIAVPASQQAGGLGGRLCDPGKATQGCRWQRCALGKKARQAILPAAGRAVAEACRQVRGTVVPLQVVGGRAGAAAKKPSWWAPSGRGQHSQKTDHGSRARRLFPPVSPPILRALLACPGGSQMPSTAAWPAGPPSG